MTLPDEPRSTGAVRLHDIAAGLTAIGLVMRLHRTRAGMDLTATLHSPGHRDIQVIVDEDGYTELRYWASLSGTPAAAVATIADAIAAITASGSLANRAGQTDRHVAGYDGAVTERAEGSGMPGPQDHLAEQGRIPDQARPYAADSPHDARVRPDDLHARLERLPLNHPSSPYRDDGSRKPPRPDLAQYELPLPDESDSPADPHLPAADQARTALDGSWDWKEYHLTPEQVRGAEQGLTKCHDMEGRDAEGRYGERGLTPAMRRVEAQLEHGQLVPDTEQFALKDPDRYKEKFAKLIATEPGTDLSDIVTKINDGVRYTYTFQDEHYTSGVLHLCSVLTDAGFEPYERKNAWTDESKAYQGINSSWMERDAGQLFEVQMHTPASWKAKQESHGAYEIAEAPNSSPQDRANALKEQDRIFSEVPIPPDVQDIPSYRKEGW
jgi:hypothetical protein